MQDLTQANEIYTGVLTLGAYGPLGSGKRVFVPEEERVRVENAHPAIIDRDVFWEVQERMKKKRHGEAQQFLLKGLVRCGEYGRLMTREKKRFRCRYQKFTDHRNVESIPEAELEGIVWKAVDIQLRLLEEKEAVFRRERELCEERRRKLLPEIKKEDAGRKKAGRDQAALSPVQTGENGKSGVPCKEEVGRESCRGDGRGTGWDGSGG